ncbi:MAG TPA: NAD(+)/NADH kinase [Firmicutes bacterium]|nr:NAD(+)/NADH kinase [Bacillota bacterium]
MKRIGLMPNLRKERAHEASRGLLRWLEARGVEVILPEQEARAIGRPELGRPLEILAEEAEAAVVLGGDGTLLAAAKTLAPTGKPLLGINLGQLGFLSEVEIGEAEAALQRLLEGEFTLERRMMLQATVVRRRCPEECHHALNDVVINRGTLARIITLEAVAGEERIERFRGDGLIVATPTGSTAYSLAAGGPILSPQLDAILLTPICPHSLYARSLVLGPEVRLRIRVLASSEEVALTVDGQVGEALNAGDEVTIVRSPLVTSLVRLKPPGFFRVVHTRLSHLTPF